MSRAAVEELARRELRRREGEKLKERLFFELFDKQINVWNDPSEHIAVICPRRSGKTSLWERFAVGESLMNDNVLIRIWHISRIRVKQFLYTPIENVCKRYRIPYKANETELTFKFENGSEIRLVGADKDRDMQKKRGDKVWIDILLEAQGFGALLKGLVDDIIEPALMDERQRGGGRLYLEGSPGPVCAGLWYDITGREDMLSGTWPSVGADNGDGRGYSCHRWQAYENPFMPHIKAEHEKIKKARRWTEANPTFRREHMGLWVNDYDALYYKYDERRNGFNEGDVIPWGAGWQHVLGWDLGSTDDMALVAWGYHPEYPDLYEAFSWKKPGALASEVMAEIDGLIARGFDFVSMVADTQGGGKMYVEDVQSRYSHTFKPAKKSEKYDHVTMYNDDLLTGHIKLRKGSPLETELKELPRDPDWNPASGKPPKEAAAYPNHCADASLYAWREARHYWHTPKDTSVKKDVDAVEEFLVAKSKEPKKDWLEQWASSFGENDGFS